MRFHILLDLRQQFPDLPEHRQQFPEFYYLMGPEFITHGPPIDFFYKLSQGLGVFIFCHSPFLRCDALVFFSAFSVYV